MVDVNTLLVQSFSDADFYEALGRAAGNKTKNEFTTPGADWKIFAPNPITHSVTTNYGKFSSANTVIRIDSVEVFSERIDGATFVNDCYDCDNWADFDLWSSQTHKVTFSFKYKYQDTKGTHTASYKLVINPEKNEVKDGIDLLCPTQAPCQNYGGLTEEMVILGIREYLGLDNTQLVTGITKAKEEAARLQEEAAREAARLKEEAYQKSRPTLFGQ